MRVIKPNQLIRYAVWDCEKCQAKIECREDEVIPSWFGQRFAVGCPECGKKTLLSLRDFKLPN